MKQAESDVTKPLLSASATTLNTTLKGGSSSNDSESPDDQICLIKSSSRAAQASLDETKDANIEEEHKVIYE